MRNSVKVAILASIWNLLPSGEAAAVAGPTTSGPALHDFMPWPP